MFKFFALRFPLHQSSDGLLPPDPPDVIPPSPTPVPGRVVCEFCECQLTPHGHALKISTKAREYRDQIDVIEKLKRDLDHARELEGVLRGQIAQRDADLKALTDERARSRSPFSK